MRKHAYGALLRPLFQVFCFFLAGQSGGRPPRPNQFGGEYREEAIAVQIINHNRLSLASAPRVLDFYDGINAFRCGSRGVLGELCEVLNNPPGIKLFINSLRDPICCVTCSDGVAVSMPRPGVPQGHTLACRFANGVWAKVTSRLDITKSIQPLLNWTSPTTGEITNTSTTGLVDDVAACTGKYDNMELCADAQKTVDAFGEALRCQGFARNIKKERRSFPFLVERPSLLKSCLEIFALFNIRKEARYLGPLIHWNGSNKPFLDMLRTSAADAWYRYGFCWRGSVDRRFRQLVFRSVAVGSPISGAARVALTKTDAKQLDQCFFVHFSGNK